MVIPITNTPTWDPGRSGAASQCFWGSCRGGRIPGASRRGFLERWCCKSAKLKPTPQNWSLIGQLENQQFVDDFYHQGLPASHLWEHLRYINNILTVGMVPALFPDDEKEPLVGAIRARRSRQPPSIHQVFPLWFSHWNWELTIFCGFKIWFYLLMNWNFHLMIFPGKKIPWFLCSGPGEKVCPRRGCGPVPAASLGAVKVSESPIGSEEHLPVLWSEKWELTSKKGGEMGRTWRFR